MKTRFRPARSAKYPSLVLGHSDPDLMPDERCSSVGGVAVPRRFTAEFRVDGADLIVRATIRIARGMPIVESLELIGTHRTPPVPVRGEAVDATLKRGMADQRIEGPTLPITPAALRELADRLDAEVRSCVLLWAPHHTIDDTGRVFLDTRELSSMRRSMSGKVVRRAATDDDLKEVAAVYRANPVLPRQAVAEHFGISDSKASRWIKAAREDGHLKAAPGPGKSGEANV